MYTKLKPDNAIIAITTHSVLCAPVLEAVSQFETEAEAVRWINEHAVRWYLNNKAIANDCNGKFVVIDHEDSEIDEGFEFFSRLTEVLILEANGGEEMFLAAVDSEWLESKYGETSD